MILQNSYKNLMVFQLFNLILAYNLTLYKLMMKIHKSVKKKIQVIVGSHKKIMLLYSCMEIQHGHSFIANSLKDSVSTVDV